MIPAIASVMAGWWERERRHCTHCWSRCADIRVGGGWDHMAPDRRSAWKDGGCPLCRTGS